MFDLGSKVVILDYTGTVIKVTYTVHTRWYSVHLDNGVILHGLEEKDVNAVKD